MEVVDAIDGQELVDVAVSIHAHKNLVPVRLEDLLDFLDLSLLNLSNHLIDSNRGLCQG